MEYDLNQIDDMNAIPNICDVLKNVMPTKIECTNGQEVFAYWPQIFSNTKGIIFPNDDIVCLREPCDVIITNLRLKGEDGFLILSEIYHEIGIGDILPVKISERSRYKNQPMFKLHGFLGFVRSGKIDIGQKARVQVTAMKENKKANILETKLYSSI